MPGLGDSGNARKKTFFSIEAFPNADIMQKHIRFIVSFQVKSLLLVYTSFTCLGVTVLGMAGVMAYIFRMQVLFLVMKNCDDYVFTHYVMIVMTMVMTKWKGWGDGLYLQDAGFVFGH